MSYILEALRRADAERERGAVPGLHTRSVSNGAAPAAGRRPFATWALGVGAGVCVAVVGVLAWRLSAPSAAVPAAGVVLAPAVPAANVVMTQPAPAPAPPATVPAAAPAAPSAVPSPAPPAAAPVDRKVAPVVVAPSAAKPRELPQLTTPTASAPVPAVAPAPRIYTLQELPDDIRAQLPRLNVSGATYSSNPLYRMVIVSGQVLHEGEEAAGGTVLEKIEQRAVVLRFRGYRYTLAY